MPVLKINNVKRLTLFSCRACHFIEVYCSGVSFLGGSHMADHDIPGLLAGIDKLRRHLKELSDDADLRQLDAYIRQPPLPSPYTSVAEFILVSGLVQGLIAHSTAMRELK
jgi:hypothetical protein